MLTHRCAPVRTCASLGLCHRRRWRSTQVIVDITMGRVPDCTRISVNEETSRYRRRCATLLTRTQHWTFRSAFRLPRFRDSFMSTAKAGREADLKPQSDNFLGMERLREPVDSFPGGSHSPMAVRWMWLALT